MEQFKQKKKSAKVLKQDGLCYSWNRKKSVAATQGLAERAVRGKLRKADMVWSVKDLVGTDKKFVFYSRQHRGHWRVLHRRWTWSDMCFTKMT